MNNEDRLAGYLKIITELEAENQHLSNRIIALETQVREQAGKGEQPSGVGEPPGRRSPTRPSDPSIAQPSGGVQVKYDAYQGRALIVFEIEGKRPLRFGQRKARILLAVLEQATPSQLTNILERFVALPSEGNMDTELPLIKVSKWQGHSIIEFVESETDTHPFRMGQSKASILLHAIRTGSEPDLSKRLQDFVTR